MALPRATATTSLGRADSLARSGAAIYALYATSSRRSELVRPMPKPLYKNGKIGAPGTIRTSDPQIRSFMLYEMRTTESC